MTNSVKVIYLKLLCGRMCLYTIITIIAYGKDEHSIMESPNRPLHHFIHNSCFLSCSYNMISPVLNFQLNWHPKETYLEKKEAT